MATKEGEIRKIASYLCVTCGNIAENDTDKVPILKTENGSQIKGLATIAKYLARKANNTLLGTSPEEEAVINQWLEYRVAHVDRCGEFKDLDRCLQELNGYLADKVYFVGHRLTLADVVLFHALHKIFNHLTFYEKQKYMHLSRWYNQVQHCEGVPQDLPVVHFQKNIIYTGFVH